MHTHARTHARTHVRTHARTHTHRHAGMHAGTHARKHRSMNSRMYESTHARTHKSTHARNHDSKHGQKVRTYAHMRACTHGHTKACTHTRHACCTWRACIHVPRCARAWSLDPPKCRAGLRRRQMAQHHPRLTRPVQCRTPAAPTATNIDTCATRNVCGTWTGTKPAASIASSGRLEHASPIAR